MKRIIVLSMIGFVLFVFGVYVFYTAWFEISSIRLVNSTRWTFVVGIVVCFIFNRFWGAHGFFHTFTHELIHALACLLCGGSPIAFQATSKQGGAVVLNRSNFFVTLAPYIVPLWSIVALITFRILIWLKAAHVALPYVSFLTGFFMMYHLHSLWYTMRPAQPDLKKYGYVFSYGFGLFGNSIILSHIVLWTMHWNLSYSYFINKLF